MTTASPAKQFEASAPDRPLLSVDALYTEFSRGRSTIYAVNGVSFDLYRSEILVVVGESGSGKSATVRSLVGLLPSSGSVVGGSAMFEGVELLSLDGRELRAMRGSRIGMVFQDAMSYLNPVLTVGLQVMEPLMIHKGASRREAAAEAVRLLGLVGIPEPEWSVRRYPHQLSGGMRQRVMIAIAMSCDPSLLIADEPTTALDVTIQAQILRQFRKLRENYETTIIMITHDLAIAAGIADRIAVMYGGRIVEVGTTDEIFYDPRHPYTRGLLAAAPRLDTRSAVLPVGIPGDPVLMRAPLSRCAFYERCPLRQDNRCGREVPELTAITRTHYVASFYPASNAAFSAVGNDEG